LQLRWSWERTVRSYSLVRPKSSFYCQFFVKDIGKVEDQLFAFTVYTPGSDIAAGFGTGLIEFLSGRIGNDTYLGFQPPTANPGQVKIDIFADLPLDDPAFRSLSDTFILGDFNQPYYANGNPGTFGLNDFAFIVDFNPAEDFIQLNGSASDYQLVDIGIGTAIAYQQPTGLDVIGFALGATNLSLGANYFDFKGNTPPPTAVPQAQQLGTPGFDLSVTTATDPFGNVYIAGGTTGSLEGPNNGDSRDAFVAKYDSQGNLLFTTQFGTSTFDTISGIDTDAQGNFYVAGITSGNLEGTKQAESTDAFVAKFDSNGNQQWIQQFGRNVIFQSFSIDVDDAGNSYLSGIDVESAPAPEFATDNYFTTKFDTNGNQLWETEVGSVNGEFDESYGVTVANDGSVYATGWSRGDLPRIDSPGAFENEGLYDAQITKYDNNGAVQWVRQFGSSDYDWGWSTDTDSQGNVYATGWTLGNLGGQNAGSYDAWLVKYDSQGNQQFATQFGSAGDDEAFELFIDNSDNIFITGYTNGNLGGTNAGAFDTFVARYDTSGNQVWLTQFGTPDIDQGYSITADNAGNLFVTGVTQGSLGDTNAGSFDAFLAKLDAASGTLLDFNGNNGNNNLNSVNAVATTESVTDITTTATVTDSATTESVTDIIATATVTDSASIEDVNYFATTETANNSTTNDDALLGSYVQVGSVSGDTFSSSTDNAIAHFDSINGFFNSSQLSDILQSGYIGSLPDCLQYELFGSTTANHIDPNSKLGSFISEVQVALENHFAPDSNACQPQPTTCGMWA
jgi:hypothetical protein